MTRRRKLMFGLVTLVLILVSLELAARAYSRFRFGNPVALQYGGGFFRNLLDGTVSLDIGWGAGRGGDEVARSRDAAEGVDAQALFDRRSHKDDGLIVRAPMTVSFNGGHSATINSLGFRGADVSRENPADAHRIAVFGGSDVFGAYLRDEQTWAFLLQQGLRAAGFSAVVVNAGSNGANIHGVLTDVIRLTNRVDINTAIITSAYNNHALLPIERQYTAFRRADFYLYNLSMFYVMLKERMAKMISQPLDYGLYRQPIRVTTTDVDWLVNLYQKRLNQIATVCEERGIKAIFASQGEVFAQADLNAQSSQTLPTLEALAARIRDQQQLSIAELEFYLQGRLNRAAREVAEARGTPFFDGEAVLLPEKRRNFSDQIHPNENGAARLAAGLKEFLAPMLRSAAVAPERVPAPR